MASTRPEIVEIAHRRLHEHGYQLTQSLAEAGPSEKSPVLRLAPGTTFDLQVTVADDGALTLRLT